ncbi:hypothetical protein HPB50_001668 [Hyalomma asiaticum]|uniref:Uncharacterized protein n=1 Tax=Hyalomma asiaticum TaxID=266040 RepID=A0ACB7SB46_HYAAI|nr:hypothetical protein HPB50_001668 [Hyalomma asiaticum]
MPDLNPDLGPFQDSAQCYPLEPSWHIVYRNFEEDPYFGGRDKCVRGALTGEFFGDSALVKLEYQPHGVMNAGDEIETSSFCAARQWTNYFFESRNLRNTCSAHTAPKIGDEESRSDESSRKRLVNAAFKLMSSPGYTAMNIVNLQSVDRKGCSMWVSGAQLGQPQPCCDFVFKLLCGSNPVYQIYDETCH